MSQIRIYQMLDPHCAQRRIKLVLPIPIPISKSIFVPNLLCPWKDSLSLKKLQCSQDLYETTIVWNSTQIQLYNILDPTVNKGGLTLSYSSIRGTLHRSWATTSACFLSVYLNVKDKYRLPLGCLSLIQIQIQKRFRLHCGRRRLKLVLPVNQRNFA